MMKSLIAGLALGFAISSLPAAAYDETVTKSSLVLVVCRADDLTGMPGRHGVDPATGKFDETSAAKGWRDLELHVEGGELECKVVPFNNLQDATEYSKLASANLIPLDPNFVDWAQCAHAGMMISPEWDANHPGWATVAVGCPTPIMSDNGTPDFFGDDVQIGLKMPECPTYFPGTDVPMRCRFTPSMI